MRDLTALKKARDLKAKAHADFITELIKAFPVNSGVSFRRGNGVVHGFVSDHATDGRVRIENRKTSKEYWVGYSWLIDHNFFNYGG